jgi:hypothetical protein
MVMTKDTRRGASRIDGSRRVEMRIRTASVTFYALAAISTFAYSQPKCVAPDLSDRQVLEIVSKERAARKDLPAAFHKSISKVTRQGCYYSVMESKLSESPGEDDMVVLDADNSIVLNQYGVIVDASAGNGFVLRNTRKGNGCRERVLREAELTEIVRKEREIRKDLPPRLPNSRIRVDRSRCLYFYYEHEGPLTIGKKYQLFVIDPLGGVMSVHGPESF